MRYFIFTVFLFVLKSSVFSQATNVFNGTSNARWERAANWSLGREPIATDDVIINAKVCEIRRNEVARSVTINSGTGGVNCRLRMLSGSLTVQRDFTINNTTNNTGDIRFQCFAGTTFDIGGNFTITRSASNTTNNLSRLEMFTSNGSVGGNFIVNIFGGVNETLSELLITGESNLSITSNFEVNVNGSDSDFRLDLEGDNDFDRAFLIVGGDFIYSETPIVGFNDNDDLLIFIDPFANFEILGNMTINKNQGDQFTMAAFNSSAIDVTGDATINLSNLANAVRFIISGSTTSFGGSLSFNLNNLSNTGIGNIIDSRNSQFTVGNNLNITASNLSQELGVYHENTSFSVTNNFNLTANNLNNIDIDHFNASIDYGSFNITASNLSSGIAVNSTNVSLIIDNDLNINGTAIGADFDFITTSAFFQVGGNVSSNFVNSVEQRFFFQNLTFELAGDFNMLSDNCSGPVVYQCNGGATATMSNLSLTQRTSPSFAAIFTSNNDNNTISGDVNITVDDGLDGFVSLANSSILTSNNFYMNGVDCRYMRTVLESGSSFNVTNDLFYDIDQSSSAFSGLTLNAGGAATFTQANIGNYIVNHASGGSGFYHSQSGNSRTTVTNNFTVDFAANGGDEIFLRLTDANDEFSVGNDLLWNMPSGTFTETGALTTNDDLEIRMTNGVLNVGRDLSLTIDGGNRALIDKDAGVINVGNNLKLGVSNGGTPGVSNSDGDINVTGDLLCSVFTQQDDTQEFNFDISSGRIDVSQDALFYMEGSNSEFESVISGDAVFSVADTLKLTSNQATTMMDFELQSPVGNGPLLEVGNYLILDHQLGDLMFIDLDGNSNLSIGEDLVIDHLATTGSFAGLFMYNTTDTVTIGGDFRANLLSGSSTAGGNILLSRVNNGFIDIADSLIITGEGGSNIFFEVNGGRMDVGSSIYYDITGGLDARLSFSNGIGNVTNDVRMETSARNIAVVQSGGIFNIGGDLSMSNTSTSGGDTDINFSGGSTLVGNDLLLSSIVSGNADIDIDIVNATLSVANDALFNLNGSGDSDIFMTLGGTGAFTAGRNLNLTHLNGDDILVTLGNTSSLSVSEMQISKSNTTQETEIILNDNSDLNVSGNLNWTHNSTNRGEGALRHSSGTPTTNIGGDFIVNANINATDLDGRNNFDIELQGGSLGIGNDFDFNLSNGLDLDFTLDNGSTVNVGNDLLIDADAGRAFYIDLGLGGGNNTLNIGRDLNLDVSDDASLISQVRLRNTSIINIDRNVLFNAISDGQILFDLDDNSELQIAGALDRAVNGNEFGSIISEANAKVVYDGSIVQIMEKVTGGGTDEIIYGIVKIDNTSGALPAVTLETDAVATATVTGLEFTNGQLDLNNQELIVTNGGSGAVTRVNGSARSEDTDNSSILSWQIGGNTGNHLFPFSTVSGDYLPLDLDLTAGDLGTVSVATYPTSSNNLPFSPTVTKMVRADGANNTLEVADRHWQIDVTGTTPTVDVTFPYLASEIAVPNTITEANLQAQRWDAGANRWDPPVGIANTVSNTVLVTGVTEFSPWVLVDGAVPLPVEFLSLDVSWLNENLLVEWSTASEINNDYFEVYVSTDGFNYNVVGTLEGSGNSNVKNDYSYAFAPLEEGLHYIKIKQTDFDGQFEFSPVKTISTNGNSFISVFPNSVNIGETVNFVLSSIADDLSSLELVNMEGKVIKQLDVTDRKLEYQVLTSELTKGVYFIKSRTGDKTEVFKVVVR